MRKLDIWTLWLVLLMNISALASPFNESLPLILPSTSNDYNIICDGSKYGTFYSSDVSACLDAKEVIAPGRERMRFAERDTTEATEETYPLPWRWMDRTAACYLQIALKPGVPSGSNSLYKLREAASTLITHCALRQGQGGIIFNTGGDNNVGIVLGKYAPDQGSTQCIGRKATVDGCRDMMSGIPATKGDMLFGPKKPPANVELPAITRSYDRTCMLRVWTTNRDGDITSWYKIWEAVTAVYFRCISAGSQGIFRGLGDNHRLFVSLLGP